jgi:hypothetical protein
VRQNYGAVLNYKEKELLEKEVVLNDKVVQTKMISQGLLIFRPWIRMSRIRNGVGD